MREIKYWLIYSDYEGRKAKPFLDLDLMERYIERSKDYITVIAKAQTLS